MTRKERLCELIEKGRLCPEDGNPFEEEKCEMCKYKADVDCDITRLADYLIENGVIVPPVKVGDNVWAFYISHPTDYKHRKQGRRKYLEYLAPTTNAADRNLSIIIIKSKKATTSDISRIGKTVFFTREEAEKALEQRMIDNELL